MGGRGARQARQLRHLAKPHEVLRNPVTPGKAGPLQRVSMVTMPACTAARFLLPASDTTKLAERETALCDNRAAVVHHSSALNHA
jgi:hypothetical protein